MAALRGLCMFSLVVAVFGFGSPDYYTYGDVVALLEFKKQIWTDPDNVLATWVGPAVMNVTHPCNFAGITCDWGYYRVRKLLLPGKKLRGTIAPDIRNITFTWEIDLSNNQFMGTIPLSFGSLPQLRKLDLSNNLLTGVLPSDIYILQQLTHVMLSQNMLSGKLIMLNTTKIQHIDFAENNLEGTFHSSYIALRSIQYISLADNQLSGSIPSDFCPVNLTKFNISSNRFTGPIPALLASLPLQKFSVVNNSLSGEIPNTDTMRRFSPYGFLPGNPQLCGSVIDVTCPKPFKMPAWAVVLLVFLLPATLFGIAVAIYRFLFPPGEYSAWRIRNITGNFDNTNLVGVGSLCAVYKATLPNGQKVAVKRVRPEYYNNDGKKFDAERKLLMSVDHPNIVKVVGSCSSGNLKVLLMDQMVNGSLDMHLYGGGPNMPWSSRLNIAAGVAQGLAYLHGQWQGAEFAMHCDLKGSSGVLLDDNLNGRITDVRVKHADAHAVSNPEQVVFGYAPPEYAIANASVPAGEVYRFGTLMLELLTAMRPEKFTGQLGGIQGLVKQAYPDNLQSVLDPNLLQDAAHSEQMRSCAKIALECTNATPVDRPTMEDVLVMLEETIAGSALSTTSLAVKSITNTEESRSLLADQGNSQPVAESDPGASNPAAESHSASSKAANNQQQKATPEAAAESK